MADTDFEQLINKYYADDFPEFGSGPLPVEPYVSPRQFELEREHIFQKSWLLVCHESELPNPGDFVVKNLAVLGTSIVIVRGKDGVIRAFHNVCRHRGNKLVCDKVYGTKKVLFCRFHGWSYALDGRLLGVPEIDRFPGLDKDRHSLTPITIELWKGLVFVNAQEKPAQSLPEYLGKLANVLDEYPFAQMRPLSHHSATLRTNWKVAINAFQEAYHVRTVHAVSAPSLFLTRLCHFRFDGLHRSMTLP